MGQAAKYAVLASAIAVILSAIVVLTANFITPEIFSGFSSALGGVVAVLNNSVISAKGIINYFLGGGAAANAFNILLWLNLLYPVAKFAVKISIVIFRWMNQ